MGPRRAALPPPRATRPPTPPPREAARSTDRRRGRSSTLGPGPGRHRARGDGAATRAVSPSLPPPRATRQSEPRHPPVRRHGAVPLHGERRHGDPGAAAPGTTRRVRPVPKGQGGTALSGPQRGRSGAAPPHGDKATRRLHGATTQRRRGRSGAVPSHGDRTARRSRGAPPVRRRTSGRQPRAHLTGDGEAARSGAVPSHGDRTARRSQGPPSRKDGRTARRSGAPAHRWWAARQAGSRAAHGGRAALTGVGRHGPSAARAGPGAGAASLARSRGPDVHCRPPIKRSTVDPAGWRRAAPEAHGTDRGRVQSTPHHVAALTNAGHHGRVPDRGAGRRASHERHVGDGLRRPSLRPSAPAWPAPSGPVPSGPARSSRPASGR